MAVSADEVQPGDLFVALQRARPRQLLLRLIWDGIESVAPPLLKVIVWLVVRLRLSIWVSEARSEGNAYAGRAIKRGAAYAVVDNPRYARGPQYLLVKDIHETLAGLALQHRQEFPVPCLAITGSNGKTTTKGLANRVLGSHYRTLATIGSSNSLTGVSRTMLSIRDEHQIAVTEMGITQRGQLAAMCRIVQPTCGLITSIGESHLTHLKNLDGVQAAKGELFDYLCATGGHLFVSANDERVSQLAGNYEPTTRYGSSSHCQIRGEILRVDPYLVVRWYRGAREIVDIQTQLAGVYNLDNVLAAIAVGVHFDVPAESIVSAIAGYQTLPNRSQLIRSGSNVIILDAHNANPTSMSAALQSLKLMPQTQKVVMLGDMLDLGWHSKQAHSKILRELKPLGLTAIGLVGGEFRRVGDSSVGNYFSSAADARRWLQAQKYENTCILVKGSRRMRMETIVEFDR